jgi:8-oxo-dGTP pyrophosphatase MutT (NUDIX family)
MEWKTHGEPQIYTNKWVNLCLVDVQQPDGRRWKYHVVRLRHLAVAAVVNDRQEVLMMWRHRFITDSWAWELPMGLVEEGETPEEAAAREVLEETGWRPGPIKPPDQCRARQRHHRLAAPRLPNGRRDLRRTAHGEERVRPHRVDPSL